MDAYVLWNLNAKNLCRKRNKRNKGYFVIDLLFLLYYYVLYSDYIIYNGRIYDKKRWEDDL